MKLAAVGTVADVVPLRGENRVIARLGLERLSRKRHAVGLQALLESAGLLGETLTGFHVAFRLAPRINAAGRMSTPDLATRLLLLTDDERADEARGLAEQLEAVNLRRQEEEAEILAAARRRVDSDPDVGAHAILVVWGAGWHRGVIGIVASKLVDRFHRPAIVLAVEGDVAHGSGRSIPGFDLLAALEHCGELFTRFGGHRHAAGVTIDAARLPELRRRITAFADDRLGPEQLMPRLRIDCRLPLAAITPEMVAGLRAMEPFGAGNAPAGVQLGCGPARGRPSGVEIPAPRDAGAATGTGVPGRGLADGGPGGLREPPPGRSRPGVPPDREPLSGRAHHRAVGGGRPVRGRRLRRRSEPPSRARALSPRVGREAIAATRGDSRARVRGLCRAVVVAQRSLQRDRAGRGVARRSGNRRRRSSRPRDSQRDRKVALRSPIAARPPCQACTRSTAQTPRSAAGAGPGWFDWRSRR